MRIASSLQNTPRRTEEVSWVNTEATPSPVVICSVTVTRALAKPTSPTTRVTVTSICFCAAASMVAPSVCRSRRTPAAASSLQTRRLAAILSGSEGASTNHSSAAGPATTAIGAPPRSGATSPTRMAGGTTVVRPSMLVLRTAHPAKATPAQDSRNVASVRMSSSGSAGHLP
ncbi:MAG: hypothetical protein R3F29_05995 [Planctomycetota bacterium]